MCIRLKSCCFGYFSLESGSKAIAIIEMIFSALNLLFSVISLNLFRMATKIISIGISFLLLHGVNKRKTGYLLAWMVIRAIGVVAIAALAAICFAFFFFTSVDKQQELCAIIQKEWGGRDVAESVLPGAFLPLLAITFTILLVVNLYMVVVVYSFYKKISDLCSCQVLGMAEQGMEVGYSKAEEQPQLPQLLPQPLAIVYRYPDPPPGYYEKALA